MKIIISRAAFIPAAFTILIWTTACQTSPEPRSANENRSANNTATVTTTNVNQPAVANTEITSARPGDGSLATPTETYKTGYAARQKKDIAGLKRVFSKDALEFLTEVGKAEQKTLDDQLRELAERPQAATDETRNEKISGDRATLEYPNERGKWVSMDFVKESNDWKIDLPKAK